MFKLNKIKDMSKINLIKYVDLATPELIVGAVENLEPMEGFREDFHILHCLVKIHKPKTFLEIGTNLGTGVSIVYNAGLDYGIKVSSLDLAEEFKDLSLQYPGKDMIGTRCKIPYTQLLGDSMTFDYESIYPIDGWFIDGEHDYKHAHHESVQAIKSNAILIVWHDSDI